MREILFKGKWIVTGKWVEGFYYKMSETTYCCKEDYERNPVPEHHYILQEQMTDWGLPNQIIQIEVDPESICQYTGRNYRDGESAYENDILNFHFRNGDICAPIKYGFYRNPYDSGSEGHIGFYIDWPDKEYLRKDLAYWIDKINIKHVGNTLDNPELLQEAEK